MEIPTCMVFAGHDPVGGAGIQADIETLSSMGVHATSIVTALTVQDTTNVYEVAATETGLLIHQSRTLLDDIRPAAIKIGLIPDVATAEAVHTLLTDLPGIPVVLDPVYRAGGGHSLHTRQTRDALRSLLFPLATVITPNIQEAQAYTENADVFKTTSSIQPENAVTDCLF